MTNQSPHIHTTTDHSDDAEQQQDAAALINLLLSWNDDDPEDQRETWEALKAGLEQDPFRLQDESDHG